MNIEELKKFVLAWFKRGIWNRREEDECLAFCEGMELGIRIAMERYRPDKAVFEANSAGTEIDDYLYELRNND